MDGHALGYAIGYAIGATGTWSLIIGGPAASVLFGGGWLRRRYCRCTRHAGLRFLGRETHPPLA